MQDELTLKEFILVIQEYFVYFLRKWYWVALGTLVVGGVFFYNAYTAPVNYDAPLTFMMNNEKGASAGAGEAVTAFVKDLGSFQPGHRCSYGDNGFAEESSQSCCLKQLTFE